MDLGNRLRVTATTEVVVVGVSELLSTFIAEDSI